MTTDAAGRLLASQLLTAIATGHPMRAGERVPDWWPATFEPGCNHVREDEPVVAHLTAPSVIRCTACGIRFMEAAVEVDPDRCDRCRRPVPDGWFHEVSLSHGRTLVVGNVCKPCRDGLLSGTSA